MRFAFDPTKAAANLKKHGVSFADAEGVLLDPLAITIEDFEPVNERRFIAIGQSHASELLVVVFTGREDSYRLISARRATRTARTQYET